MRKMMGLVILLGLNGSVLAKSEIPNAFYRVSNVEIIKGANNDTCQKIAKAMEGDEWEQAFHSDGTADIGNSKGNETKNFHFQKTNDNSSITHGIDRDYKATMLKKFQGMKRFTHVAVDIHVSKNASLHEKLSVPKYGCILKLTRLPDEQTKKRLISENKNPKKKDN